MRILVISDIHANVTALEAVLEQAGAVDETWCLGDMVGYGPDPNAVVERMRDIPNLTCLLGNHDVAVIGKIPFEAFNGAHAAEPEHAEQQRQERRCLASAVSRSPETNETAAQFMKKQGPD